MRSCNIITFAAWEPMVRIPEAAEQDAGSCVAAQPLYFFLIQCGRA